MVVINTFGCLVGEETLSFVSAFVSFFFYFIPFRQNLFVDDDVVVLKEFRLIYKEENSR